MRPPFQAFYVHTNGEMLQSNRVYPVECDNSSSKTERLVGKMLVALQFARIGAILDGGLHPYLRRFFEQIFGLVNRISRDFFVPLEGQCSHSFSYEAMNDNETML